MHDHIEEGVMIGQGAAVICEMSMSICSGTDCLTMSDAVLALRALT